MSFGQSRSGGFSRNDGGSGRDYNNDYDGGGGVTVNMYVPSSGCGRIIGRGGQKIRDLQDQTGCKITVSRDDEGDNTRRVDLSGTEEAIADARDMINRLLEDDPRGPGGGGPPPVSGGGMGGGGGFGGGAGGGGSAETIQIDSNCVGRIIGKGGQRVRDLQNDTGCKINVARDGGRDGRTDVQLSGSREAIRMAKDAIDDITSQQQQQAY